MSGAGDFTPQARRIGLKQAAVLKNLRHLVAAAEAGSFHKAADRLGIVQSAMSRRIAEVEQVLGGPVFRRTAFGVCLTEAGQALYDDADRLLDELERMVRRFELLNGGEISPLRVAFNAPAMMHAALPLGFQTFRQTYPNVDLSLIPMPSQAQFPMLETGAIDVGVAFDLGLAPALRSVKLAMDRLVLAIPAHHPLASRVDIGIGDLAGASVVGMERPQSGRLAELAFVQLHQAGVTVRTVFTAATTEIALGMVAAGLGLAFINRSQTGREPPSVVIRDVPGFDVPLPLNVHWAPSVETPILLAFVETLRSAFAAVGGPSLDQLNQKDF